MSEKPHDTEHKMPHMKRWIFFNRFLAVKIVQSFGVKTTTTTTSHISKEFYSNWLKRGFKWCCDNRNKNSLLKMKLENKYLDAKKIK